MFSMIEYDRSIWLKLTYIEVEIRLCMLISCTYLPIQGTHVDHVQEC